MIYGVTTGRRFVDTINEQFYPSCDFDFIPTLYESMHSFGAADFLHDALNLFYKEVKSNIEDFQKSGVNSELFLVNKNETVFFDNIDVDYEHFDVPELIEYQTNTNWCNDLTISASIFVADSLSEAKRLFRKTMPYSSSFNCKSVRNSAYICMFSLAYINGEIINIFDSLMSTEEGLYHELMHKYVNNIDATKNRTSSRHRPSYFLNSILPLSDEWKNLKNDKIISGVFYISYLLYALSDSEMPAHLAQNKERFTDVNILSKNDFYKLLHSSIGYKIINTANDAIRFIDNYLRGNITESTDFKLFLLEINKLTSFDINNADDLLKKLVSEWNVNSLVKFERELIKRVGIFKHKLYNVAYDSLPDSVKHKITSEYFSV